MAYTKVTNFAVKDGLPSGNPSKIVKGTEIDVEFNAIQAESASVISTLSGKQPLDATLTSIAALGTAADKLAYTTGVDTWVETPLTATARTILDDATVADMRTTLGAAASGANTDITSLNAPVLGAATATTQAGGDSSTKVATTAFVASAIFSGGTSKIQPISASVAANALTISASALSLDFRSTTLGNGTITTVSGTPANLVISAGSTLGTINTVQSRIVVIALNNAGTIELAAVNITGGTNLDETGLISTTAEGGAGAADSATVVYSTTARTNVAYRVIGYVESTQATAGTWATAPSTIQGIGGNAMRYQMLTIPAVATTSGTSIDFTGIPSWVKRITVMFNELSTNGTSLKQIQIGDSGGIETTGYTAIVGIMANLAVSIIGASGSGYCFGGVATADSISGHMILTHVGSNVWVSSSAFGNTGSSQAGSSGGTKTLTGTLDRLRLTTINGTDVFDAGSVSLLLEG
jgi:hypothetical protein